MHSCRFFADSYDLFVIDGVNNMIKNLGPAVTVKYNTTSGTVGAGNVVSYFTGYCPSNNAINCLPNLYNPVTQSWYPNPNTVYTNEFVPIYQAQTTDLKNSIANAAIIGSILGQLLFGFFGDMIGRKWNFVATATLIILGCLGSATSMLGKAIPCPTNAAGVCGSNTQLPQNSMYDVYIQLTIWRGILGFGVGGEYPLASTITSESATFKERGRAIATTFSMQGWGKLAGAIMDYAVIATCTYFGGTLPLDGAWRVALACGCIPNILTIYFRFLMHESPIYTETKKAELELKDGEIDVEGAVIKGADGKTKIATMDWKTSLAILWEFKWTLVGTASTWFLIDVTFYGQGLMNSSVVQAAVASTAGLTAMQSLLQCNR